MEELYILFLRNVKVIMVLLLFCLQEKIKIKFGEKIRTKTSTILLLKSELVVTEPNDEMIKYTRISKKSIVRYFIFSLHIY